MTQSLAPASTAVASLVAAKCQKKDHSSRLHGLQIMQVPQQKLSEVFDSKLTRRAVAWSLAGAVLGLSTSEWSANAAARRPPPPPPPPEEKKDPNLSGVQAKVLASKKRKEAMKQSMAKLREKGKAINEPPS